MRAFEVAKNEAEIRRGLILMAVEGVEADVAQVSRDMKANGYPSTDCSEYGDREGEIVEFFSISRSDKADFMRQYKNAKTKNERRDMASITHLKDVKARKLRSAVEAITSQLSDVDIQTLQHDVLCAPAKRTMLPASMVDDFKQWLDDSYGPVEREEKMAPEIL